MTTGVDFLDNLSRGVAAVFGVALLFEIGVQWFRASVRHASDDDAGF